MALSDTAIKAAKPSEKPRKLADEKGLYLLIQPSGAKLWRLKYRILGKEKKFSLGIYPDVPLKEARRLRDEARKKIAANIDPGEVRRLENAAAAEATRHTFSAVGNEYLAQIEQEGRAAVTIKKSRWLLSLMNEELGSRPVSAIKPADLLATLKKTEQKGHYETARRMRSLAGRVFRFAVSTSRAELDPSAMLKGALVTPQVKHRSAIVKPEEVGQLLRAIDGFIGQPLTHLALKITPHLFVRPGELRRAEWQEFDLDKAVWTIPATKMKMREAHRVPLST